MSKKVCFVLAALVCLLALPAAARAQSAIAGVVKDASGAVLPGVTVEASSDVLIEKSRVAVTDGSGAYKLINLRPGTYLVTITLTGFQTFKREGLETPERLHGEPGRGPQGRRARRNGHRLGRLARRRRAEQREVAGALA